MHRSDLLLRLKANYGAKVGGVIQGRLKRGQGGRFSSAGSGGAAEQQPRVTATPARPSSATRRTLQQRRQRLARQAQEARRMMNSRVKVAQRKQQKQGGGGGSSKNSPEAKQAAQQANRIAVAEKTALSPQSVQILARLADDEAVETIPAELAQNGLIDANGVTDQGRRYLRSAERGNVREALAAIQDGRAIIARKQLQARRQTRRKATAPEASHIAVFKASDGRYWWIARSSTAFNDRDNDIVSTEALIESTEYLRQTGDYGPLRWWHQGEIDDTQYKAGRGIDIGDCHGSVVVSKTLVEWGTFRRSEYAKIIRPDDGISITFKPLAAPTLAETGHNVYTRIRRMERSVAPSRYVRNPDTVITVGASPL